MAAGWAPTPPATVWLTVSLRKKDLNSFEDEGKDIEEGRESQKAQGHAYKNLWLENHVFTIFIDKQSVQGCEEVYRATSQPPFRTDPLGSADGESVTQLLMLQRLGWMSNDSFRPGFLEISPYPPSPR